MNYLEYEDYLYHWGIKGMKWGVRRFRNKDDSLTAAGKKRYDYYDEKGPGGKKSVSNTNKSIHGKNTASKTDINKEPSNSKTTRSNDRKSKITEQELRDYRHEMADKYAKNSTKKNFYLKATDAEIREDIDRKQTMKKVALTAALAAGLGAGCYLAYKYSAVEQIEKAIKRGKIVSTEKTNDYVKHILETAQGDMDTILTKGSKIHRMAAYADIDFSKVTTPTYVAYKEKDVLTYMTQLKDWTGTGERYRYTFRAEKNIRIPSEEKAKKIFQDLWDSDPTYKDKLSKTLEDTFYDLVRKSDPLLGDADARSYAKWRVERDLNNDPFKSAIYSIVRQGDDSKQLISRFAQQGYNAIEDYFDKGSFTDSPVIIFDPSSTLVRTGFEHVTERMKRLATERLREIRMGG